MTPREAGLEELERFVRVARSRIERIAERYAGQEAALWAGWALADLDAALARSESLSPGDGPDVELLGEALHNLIGRNIYSDVLAEAIAAEYARLAATEQGEGTHE